MSVEDKTDVALTSGRNLLHHYMAKRESGKKTKAKRGERKKKGQKNLKGTRIGKKIREKRKGRQNGNNLKEKEGKNGKGRKQKGIRPSRKKFIQNPKSKTYEDCVKNMKDFTSKLRKANNLDKQSKRIGDFKDIIESKKNKVIKL